MKKSSQITESKNIELQLNPPLPMTSWDDWLIETEKKLKELGYSRHVQNHKKEDFCYWKTFKKGNDKLYQIGILFYDFRKYASNRIGIMYECMLLCDNRIDMSVSENIELKEFELMSATFHEAMSKHCR